MLVQLYSNKNVVDIVENYIATTPGQSVVLRIFRMPYNRIIEENKQNIEDKSGRVLKILLKNAPIGSIVDYCLFSNFCRFTKIDNNCWVYCEII
jgi:hypothetical protein